MKLFLFMHLAGAVMLLGNSVTAAFWKIRADFSGDPKLKLQTAKNILLADYWFTLPSIALILLSGHLLASSAGYTVFAWSWLGLAYGLFVLSGVIWLSALLPAQIAMIRQGEISCAQGKMTGAFRRASLVWNVFGTAVTLAVIAAMALMVWKPHL